jgi:hypothetical protein
VVDQITRYEREEQERALQDPKVNHDALDAAFARLRDRTKGTTLLPPIVSAIAAFPSPSLRFSTSLCRAWDSDGGVLSRC